MTEKGMRIDIEVQVSNVDNYRKRSMYYWAKLYQESISESEPYDELKKAIIINIMDFNLINETKEYHTIIEAMARTEHFLFTDVMELHYIELSKFNPWKVIEYLDGMELWLSFYKWMEQRKGRRA